MEIHGENKGFVMENDCFPKVKEPRVLTPVACKWYNAHRLTVL